MQSLYQLKITLKEIQLPIWRRLLVSGSSTLDDLHFIIQCSMGWLNHYLHYFEYQGIRYESQDIVNAVSRSPHVQETTVRLAELGLQVEREFLYVYEFVDYWEHEIVVEAIQESNVLIPYAYCLDGRSACPPEDCGGPKGYQKILEALDKQSDVTHQDVLEWLPKDFDPYSFDKEVVNTILEEKYILRLKAQ